MIAVSLDDLIAGLTAAGVAVADVDATSHEHSKRLAAVRRALERYQPPMFYGRADLGGQHSISDGPTNAVRASSFADVHADTERELGKMRELREKTRTSLHQSNVDDLHECRKRLEE